MGTGLEEIFLAYTEVKELLKKLFSFLFSKKEGAVSLKVSMEMELKITPQNIDTPEQKVAVPKVQKEAVQSVQPEKFNADNLTYEEEIFLINVSAYQLEYMKHSGVKDPGYSFSIYLAESQICLTYRADTKKWECFYNSFLWDHLTTITSYDVDRDKLKYLTRTMEVRRVPYAGVMSLEQLLSLIQKDFVSKTERKVPVKTHKIHWEQWKELTPV